MEREKRAKFDLGGLLAHNQGLGGEPMEQIAQTPIINGYKMLKDTP